MTSDGVHTYQWDAEQRMISVDSGSTASYVYNALGERVEKHVGTSYVEYIFNPEEIQADASDRSTSCCVWEYLFFGARRFGKYASNETYFSHADKIHTMGTVTDYTGAVVQDAIYHPWGQEWTMAGTMMDERFASLNQRDTESSLDPTHFRMMSSYVGRWMSPDPVEGFATAPQSLDRYAYAANAPCTFADSSGAFSLGRATCSSIAGAEELGNITAGLLAGAAGVAAGLGAEPVAGVLAAGALAAGTTAAIYGLVHSLACP